MRIPEWPLCRMLSPISSAVICSTMRAFSSLPPSRARTPGIFAASARTAWLAAGSSLHTMTSQSTAALGVQNISRSIVKGSDHRNALGHKFGGLLGGGALPDAERAGGASADAGGKRDGSIDDDAPGANRGLDLLEQRGVRLRKEW